MVENFFLPWGYVLNGQIKYKGSEYEDDQGILIFENNNLYKKLFKWEIENYIDEDGEEILKYNIIGEKNPMLLYKVNATKLD
jgi:hypothetical protein